MGGGGGGATGGNTTTSAVGSSSDQDASHRIPALDKEMSIYNMIQNNMLRHGMDDYSFLDDEPTGGG